jgi:hypothetical protein
MTALKKYQKIEATGLWRETPAAQRREVVVAFGDASLVLSDPRTGTALTHWSLPAVTRLNGSDTPALYAPDAGGDETLELDDPTLVGAIETVRAALADGRPRPGRLRAAMVAGVLAALAVVAVVWLPDALVRQTAGMVPPATRAEIGRLALADLTRLTGLPCAAPLGVQAAARLTDRLFAPGPEQILILRDGLRPAAHLPGGLILLSRGLVDAPDGPDVAAGFALAEAARARAADPLVPLLRHAGPLATLRLFTTGSLPAATLAGYAELLLSRPLAPLPAETLLADFAAAGVPSAPFAYALDPTGETVLDLIEADPLRDRTPAPLLPDGDWISLQTICQGG